MGAPPTHVASAPSGPLVSSDRVDTAINGGVKFLLTQQNAGGAIVDPALGPKYQTATTSLGVLALLAAGHHPTEKSPEGIALKRAMSFLLRSDRQDTSGYFGAADNSTMHGHGVTTLALCESIQLGVEQEQDELLRRKATLALNLIIRSQGATKQLVVDIGGWRYQPLARDSDLSATIWQLFALRSGQKAGFVVPPLTVKAADQFLVASFWRNPSIFTYDPIPPIPQPTDSSPKDAKGSAQSKGSGSTTVGSTGDNSAKAPTVSSTAPAASPTSISFTTTNIVNERTRITLVAR